MEFTQNLDGSINFVEKPELTVKNSVWRELEPNVNKQLVIAFHHHKKAKNRFLALDNKDTTFVMPFEGVITNVSWKANVPEIAAPNNGIRLHVDNNVYDFYDVPGIPWANQFVKINFYHCSNIKVWQRGLTKKPMVHLTVEPI